MMNFADGLKEITEGMQVAYDKGKSGRHLHVIQSTVTKIGNKFVTLDNGDKFYIENGKQQTEYVSGELYSSIEAYQESKMQDKVIREVQSRLRDVRLTYPQALEFQKLLDIHFPVGIGDG